MAAITQPPRHSCHSRGWVTTLCGLLPVLLATVSPTAASELEDVRKLFLAGQYTQVVALAEAEYKDKAYSEQWPLLLVEALQATGRYAEALQVITNKLANESRSVRLRWLGRDAFQMNGQPDQARVLTREITELVAARPWAYRDPADLVVFGRAALLEGAEPKRVLDRVFEPARKADPAHRDAHLAIGELALDKHDFALAAKTFQEALKKVPDDPDVHFGLARAYAPSESLLTMVSLEAVLQRNSNHVATLLFLADHAIDAEEYKTAEKYLDRVRAVNPRHPEEWAYRAVIAHLLNQPEREKASRQAALQWWPTNPRVPHLMGRKFSLKYRFAEAAAQQRQALQFDPEFLPAKAHLAQDLLRLGDAGEGWRLAEEVHKKDAYDVAAMNLVTLRDTMAKFQTLQRGNFTVRMAPREAALYGSRALALLESAQARLGDRYGFKLAHPVQVEIFPEQKDFAVRTFGMPENHGFLGVCFGPVITANSPASRPGQPFNWEAMLWHEFTHVVTLQLTGNKMPRWLSEGISVYEERQANPAWGESLIPRYREMLLDGELTPVSELSAAFLAPRSAVHLQFAYYQCSLVVEFLVDRFGFEGLKSILRHLDQGMEINAALESEAAPMALIEQEFELFAWSKAEQMAPGLDWTKPDPSVLKAGDSEQVWNSWGKLRPTNYWFLARESRRLAENKHWTEARPLLEQLARLYPNATGPDSPWLLLARVHRALNDPLRERQALSRLAELDGEAPEAYARLMELAAATNDWSAVILNAQRYLAVNPLVPLPHRFLAQAAEMTGDTRTAIEAQRALLELDPPNPAEVHYQLARQLQRQGDLEARRQVLLALESAPRHRDALRLLLELQANGEASGNQTAAEPAKPPASTKPGGIPR